MGTSHIKIDSIDYRDVIAKVETEPDPILKDLCQFSPALRLAFGRRPRPLKSGNTAKVEAIFIKILALCTLQSGSDVLVQHERALPNEFGSTRRPQ